MANPATLVTPAVPKADEAGRTGNADTLVNPFTRASREHVEPFHDDSRALHASNTHQVGPVDVPAFGYLRHIVLLVTAAGGAGGSAVAHEDSPWRALDNVQLTDVNGAPIVGPFSGYDLYLANKYGAYAHDTEPLNSPAFSAVSANGDFTFILRVPCEIAGRDALGALPNQNAASTYKFSYTVRNGGAIYSTPPVTTLPTLRVRCWLEAWSQPPQVDLRGLPNMVAPPALGTTQYWAKTVLNVNAGENRLRLTRVGNLLRNLVFIFRNVTPVRNHTNFPDPLRIEWDGKILVNIGRDLLRHYVRERYGFAPDTGVIVLDFTHDLDYKPGNELRDLYIPTTQATRLELVGSFGVAGTLDVLTNDVAPAGDVYEDVR